MSIVDPEVGAQELRRLQNERKRIVGNDHRLNFYFNDPHPGFNRGLVKGKLFMIFSAK